MSGQNYGSGGCGCGGGSKSKSIVAGGTAIARTGYHPKARSAGKATSGGCGCGGSCSGDCGCDSGGGSADASCGCNPGVLVQPSFFAGQLLTDDDLQALTNYVVTKQRLHNRFLIGSGVACGLAVTCHPCGGGRVIVQPGYAVDCSGNEILVPCAVELDINAMVRALKISMQGQDCGDPCAEPVKDRSKQSRAAQLAAGAVVNAPDDNEYAERGRRYCLYLNYCEEPTDLVAPYSQDDSCAVTCQPSRLREGFNFELRCPSDDPEPPSFLDRLKCCIGDLGEADRNSSEIERSQAWGRRNSLGVAAYALKTAPQFDHGDVNLIVNANLKFPTTALDEATLRTTLDHLHAVGAATARFYMLSSDDATSFKKQLGSALANNQKMLEQRGQWLDEQVTNLLTTSPFERVIARSIIAETRKYSNARLGDEERKTKAAFIFAFGGVSTPAANIEAHEALARFKAWLLRKLDGCPPTGACCMEAEINAIVIPTGEQITEETYSAIEKLARAFIRYLLDCICAALLPPCPTCDDAGVKLACLQIDDCDVCEICNLERTFLLTEHNLRYWIPLLHSFGEGLEKLCCDFTNRFKLRIRPPSSTRDQLLAQHGELKTETAFFKSGIQLGEAAASGDVFPNLVRITGLELNDVRSSLNIGGNFSRITARDPVVASLVARYTDADAAKLAGRRAFASAQAKVIKDLKQQLDKQHERIDALEKRTSS